MTMEKGSVYSSSIKQKLNTRISTESELVAVDDLMPLILWTNNFLKSQRFTTHDTIVYQDNKSAILLETNGKLSSGKRTRALNIRYFLITNQVKKGNLKIEYCSTDQMIADFMMKGLQGAKFNIFWCEIMGFGTR